MCGVDEEDMADMIRELRGYDPKPGLRFGGEPAAPVTPDIFVARTASGWMIELNSATLPRLLVNRAYHAELASGPQDKASKAWLSECLASANWLAKSLDQRARTIVRVAREIVKQQEPFFLHGVEHLKPLTLKAVADAIGMHESTVSRITTGKYMQTPRGTLELKFFFSNRLQGAEVSGVAIRAMVKRLIDSENPAVPLADDTIAALLARQGVRIARRTVAKYRDLLQIAAAKDRRRDLAHRAEASFA
jgi:RNA polymerase sigma-54 factor